MALLGVNWHKFSVNTLAVDTGGALAGIAFKALNHCLGTTPHLVMPLPISVTPILSHSGWHGMLQFGGNASQATVGVIGGSVASFPTTAFDAFVAYIQSSVA